LVECVYEKETGGIEKEWLRKAALHAPQCGFSPKLISKLHRVYHTIAASPKHAPLSITNRATPPFDTIKNNSWAGTHNLIFE
jgi:hypothetical protein